MVALNSTKNRLGTKTESYSRSDSSSARRFLPQDSDTETITPQFGGALVVRDVQGEIEYVQVSRWRRVSAGSKRRIADVVRMEQGNVAVLIEKLSDHPKPASSVWQVYDLDGHLEALVQCSADGRFGVLLDYCVQDVMRLSYSSEQGLEVVETRSL